MEAAMSSRTVLSHEFSRVFKRADLARSNGEETIVATPDECAAVAERVGLVAINALSGRLELTPWRRNGIAVTGTLQAEVVQTCVVSLEEFTETVHEQLSARFTDEHDPILKQTAQQASEVVIDPLDEDPPEILNDDGADLGELVVEHLAIALPSHPRRPGVHLSEVVAESPAAELLENDKPPSPFAVLERLKQPEDKD